MSIIRTSFCIVALTFVAAVAGSARCLTLDAAQSFEQADAVFLGQVVRGDEPYGEHAFRVLKSWKGINEPRVVVYGSAFTCGDYAFELGEVYLVYAHRSGDAFSTGACSGNRSLLNASEQLRDLQDRPAISLLPPARYGYGYGYGPPNHYRVFGRDAFRPRRSFWNIALVTGFSVSLFVSMGFALPRLRKRLAFLRRHK